MTNETGGGMRRRLVVAPGTVLAGSARRCVFGSNPEGDPFDAAERPISGLADDRQPRPTGGAPDWSRIAWADDHANAVVAYQRLEAVVRDQPELLGMSFGEIADLGRDRRLVVLETGDLLGMREKDVDGPKGEHLLAWRGLGVDPVGNPLHPGGLDLVEDTRVQRVEVVCTVDTAQSLDREGKREDSRPRHCPPEIASPARRTQPVADLGHELESGEDQKWDCRAGVLGIGRSRQQTREAEGR